MKLDQRIINYVELFFEKIPYSSKNAQIKQQIIDKLQIELNVLKEFERVVEKYNSLEKMCLLAGYTQEEIKKMKSNDHLIQLDILKKQWKKTRKNAYFIGVCFLASVIYLYNVFIDFHIIYILLSLLFGAIMFSKIMRFHKIEDPKEKYSLEAFDYLKILHDKYLKKFNNMFFAFIIFTIFCLANIFALSINSKMTEILELVNSLLLYYEIIVLFLIKNYLLLKWVNKKIGKEEIIKFQKQFHLIFITEILYWTIYFLVCLVWKNNYINTFILFLVVNFLGISIYNLYFRRKVTYHNIVINKKRIVVYTIIVFTAFAYSFMQREFWVLQPYINSIPNIGSHNNTITYNEKDGIYTIIDNDGGDFKILQLTDIHLGGSIFSYSKDLKALKAVYQLLNTTKPDLVIVTGDLTFPVGLFSLSLNNHTPVMEFASFMRNTGIPWAFTYGNHDTEAIATYSKEDLNLLYQMLSYQTSKNLLYPYIQPNITGRNNQLLEIRNKDGSLNQAIFLIDSNAYTEEGMNKYDYIHDDQVEWYQSQILRLEKEEQKKISSMLFFHIPLQQYKTAYQLYESGSNEVTYYFGSNDEKLFDKVCASEYPSKIFDVALALDSTKAMFCGHDHYNNMSLEYQGIRLTYGMSIDYLAMPGISKDTKQRGATLITVHEDNKYDISQIPLISIQ